MRAPSQRRALGALFAVLTAFFAVIAAAAANAAQDRAMLWVVTVAAAALALWTGSLAVRAFLAR